MLGVHRVLKENIAKNLILVALLAIMYPIIKNIVLNSNLMVDKSSAGSIMVVASIFSVTACFGNFAFTYEKINIINTFERYLAHVTSGVFMLVIGMTLIITAVLASIMIGASAFINLTLLLLYIGCTGFDFWDLYRIVC